MAGRRSRIAAIAERVIKFWSIDHDALDREIERRSSNWDRHFQRLRDAVRDTETDGLRRALDIYFDGAVAAQNRGEATLDVKADFRGRQAIRVIVGVIGSSAIVVFLTDLFNVKLPDDVLFVPLWVYYLVLVLTSLLVVALWEVRQWRKSERLYAHSYLVLRLLNLRSVLCGGDQHDWFKWSSQLIKRIELSADALRKVPRIGISEDQAFNRETWQRFEQYSAFLLELRKEVVSGTRGWQERLKREVDHALSAAAENRLGDLRPLDVPGAESLSTRAKKAAASVLMGLLLVAASAGLFWVGPSQLQPLSYLVAIAGLSLIAIPVVGPEFAQRLVDMGRQLIPGRSQEKQ